MAYSTNEFLRGVPTAPQVGAAVEAVNNAYNAIDKLTDKSTPSQRATAALNLEKAQKKLNDYIPILQDAIARLNDLSGVRENPVFRSPRELASESLQKRLNAFTKWVDSKKIGNTPTNPRFTEDYVGYKDSLFIQSDYFNPKSPEAAIAKTVEQSKPGVVQYPFNGLTRSEAIAEAASYGSGTDAYNNAVKEVGAQYDWSDAAARYAQQKGIQLPQNFPLLARYIAADLSGVASGNNKFMDGGDLANVNRLFSETLNSTSSNPYIRQIQDLIKNPQAFVDYFASNPADFYTKVASGAVYNLIDNKVYGGAEVKIRGLGYVSGADTDQKILNDALSSAARSGASTESLYGAMNQAQQRFKTQYEYSPNKSPDWVNQAFDFALAAGFSALIGVPKTFTDIAVATALNSAKAYFDGANTEQIIRAAVGSLAASQVPQYLTEFKKAIGAGEVLSSAIDNAAVQATYATVTEQDVLKNAIAGAIGGTATSLAKMGGVDDPLYQKTLGEYTKYRALGLSAQDAALLAASDYAGDLSAEAGQKPVTEGMAAVSPRKGAQIGDPLASVGDIDITVPSEIASLQQFKTMPGETGTNIYKVTEQDGTVTYQKIISGKFPDGGEFGYTIQFDPQTNSFSYEYSTGAPGTETYQVVSKKSRPVEGMPVEDVARTLAPPRLTGLQGQRMPGADYGLPVTGGGGRAGAAAGADAGEGGTLPAVEVTAPVEEMPTLALLRRVRTGEETAPDAITRTLPEVEVTGQRPPEEEVPETQRLIQPAETEGTRRADEQEEPIAQRQPTDSVILDLISGGTEAQRAARQQRAPDERELASMQALSQALRIGDPGEPLFGGRLGRRRNVWNVESLRLKDELGG